MTKVKVFSLSVAFLFLLGAVVAAGATVYEVPGDYATIQQAVAAAGSGDTIVVLPGTYPENIIVNTDHLTVESQSGAEATIVQAVDPLDAVFYVAADSVTIEGFTVQGRWYGILLDSVHNCNISENTVTLNEYAGILLQNSSNNTLTGNTASGNEGGEEFACGIFLESSSHNTLTGNDASDNAWNGIFLLGSDWNILTNNTASGNRCNGIDIGGTDHDTGAFLPSNNNTLTGNTASGNLGQEETGCGIGLWCGSSHNTLTSNYVSGNMGGGIVLWYSSKNTLTGNTAESNQERGIMLLDLSNENLLTNNEVTDNSGPGIVLGVAIPEYGGCSDNELEDNTVSRNTGHGIELAESSDNTFTRNNVEGNLGSGINLISSSNNIIYLNNFIYNGQNGVSDGSLADNTWSSSEVRYNYKGSYGDGIGDTPYPIGLENDGFPLMEPFNNYSVGGGPYTSRLGNYWSDYEAAPPSDPITMIRALIEYVEDMGLPEGLENSLISKLESAIDSLENGQENAAINKLNAFINEVEAQRDKKIPTEDADYLISTAQLIIESIEEGQGGTTAAQGITQTKSGLSQNYPNPFNPETTIEYDIEKDSHVTLKIYNLAGQVIKTLVDEYQTPGHYTITWYGDTDAGQEVASGVYFYRIKAGDFVSTKKMVVLK